MPSSQDVLINCREVAGSEAAIVFIHGGGGHSKGSWGKFPEFLASDPRANGWDIYSYGYTTTGINHLLSMGLSKGVRRLMGVHTDPTVAMLTNGFHTRLTSGRLKHYAALAIVSHSLGGIVAQKMLVEYPDMRSRVQFLFMLGVSSNGFADKLLLTRNMPQIDEIRPGAPLITELRSQWNSLFVDKPAPFEYWTIAGDQDGFVPPETSLAPFPSDRKRVIPGDHESMKEPASASELSVQFVLERLAGQMSADRWGSARVAVELGRYQDAIARLEPHIADLDEHGLVTLALAYESVGRPEEALHALQHSEHYEESMDALGVLAGRLKRRWWVNRTKGDARRALGLYSEAYQRAVAGNRTDQAIYHGINVAFMRLAFLENPETAAEMAQTVLDLCKSRDATYWNLAAQGEAHLYLANVERAADCYRKALACRPAPSVRECQSMYDQAMRVISLMQDLVEHSSPIAEVFG